MNDMKWICIAEVDNKEVVIEISAKSRREAAHKAEHALIDKYSNIINYHIRRLEE